MMKTVTSMKCFRVSARSLDQYLLVLTLDDPAHTRATRNHTVTTRDRTWLPFLIFLHFPRKGTEALPASGKNNPPFPGSSAAREKEAESSGCSPFPPRLPGESSVGNSHPRAAERHSLSLSHSPGFVSSH